MKLAKPKEDAEGLSACMYYPLASRLGAQIPWPCTDKRGDWAQLGSDSRLTRSDCRSCRKPKESYGLACPQQTRSRQIPWNQHNGAKNLARKNLIYRLEETRIIAEWRLCRDMCCISLTHVRNFLSHSRSISKGLVLYEC